MRHSNIVNKCFTHGSKLIKDATRLLSNGGCVLVPSCEGKLQLKRNLLSWMNHPPPTWILPTNSKKDLKSPKSRRPIFHPRVPQWGRRVAWSSSQLLSGERGKGSVQPRTLLAVIPQDIGIKRHVVFSKIQIPIHNIEKDLPVPLRRQQISHKWVTSDGI